MTRWVFDFECTGAQRDKAAPFNLENKACNLGFKNIDTDEVLIFKLEYDEEPYGDNLQKIKELVSKATTLIGTNVKFDLHWLRRYGITLNTKCRVFDTQIAFFILTNQRNSYPSLDEMAGYFGLEKKLDIVKTEYWEKGLDTDKVPYDILCLYLEQDLHVTHSVYNALCDEFDSKSVESQKLLSVSNQDLVVLEEIEWNGLLYDKEKSLKKGDQLEQEIIKIDEQLKVLFKADWFNINSGDHLSVLLYGGTIYFDGKEDYIFTYKDGSTTIKKRNTKVPITCTGLFEPLEGTKLAKEGFYSTNEATLKTLAEKAKGEPLQVLEMLLHRAKLEKRRSTYYHGLPRRIEASNWNDNIIHSSFSQTTAVSGRLASSKPNVQNLDEQVRECFITRF